MSNYYMIEDATPETLFYEAGFDNDGATTVTFISQGVGTSSAVETFIKTIKGNSHIIRKATGAPDVSGVSSTSTLESYLTSNYSGLTFTVVE